MLGRRPGAVFRTVVLPQAELGDLGRRPARLPLHGQRLRRRRRPAVPHPDRRDLQLGDLQPAQGGRARAAAGGGRARRRRRRAGRRPPAARLDDRSRARRRCRSPLGRWRWPALASWSSWLAQRPARSRCRCSATGPGGADPDRAGRAGVRSARADRQHRRLSGLATAVITVAVVLPGRLPDGPLPQPGRRRGQRAGRRRLRPARAGHRPGPRVLGARRPARSAGCTRRCRAARRLRRPLRRAGHAGRPGRGRRRARAASTTRPACSGADRWRRLRTVELPLMLPGLLAGGGLVLLSTMKELPATLLLRPPAIDTLAVHIWARGGGPLGRHGPGVARARRPVGRPDVVAGRPPGGAPGMTPARRSRVDPSARALIVGASGSEAPEPHVAGSGRLAADHRQVVVVVGCCRRGRGGARPGRPSAPARRPTSRSTC